MALSDETQDVASPRNSGAVLTELTNNSDRTSDRPIDRFFGLLSDLKIIETPPALKNSQQNSQQITKHDLIEIPVEPVALSIREPQAPESLVSQTPVDHLDRLDLIQPFSLIPDLKPDLSPDPNEASIAAKMRSLMLGLDDHSSIDSSSSGSESNNPLEMLQDILVNPELVNVRQTIAHLETVMADLEAKVNDPALEQKLAQLENQMLDDSEMTELQQQLAEVAKQQTNIPTDVANLKQKLARLEYQVYEPTELINLLLPLVVQMLSLKVEESRAEIANAIAPIVDDMIQMRTQQDREAMSRVLADIIPNAISREIANSPETIAKAIAPEIGAAIKEQIRLDRDVIAHALAPEMGAAIKRQIELEKDAMVDALYPVIGSTITKYLSEAIRAINEKVENTFSVQGVKRKIRAKAQGVSEAELILRESMPLTVQAIFLIQKNSGLIIVDIQKAEVDTEDGESHGMESEMVAGMLTAIRSFVNDCIVRLGDVSELDQIDYGDSKIILEVAGYCYLAVVVKGEPSESFTLKLRQTFSRIIQIYGKSIEQFDGDPDTVPVQVRSQLESLIVDLSPSSQKSSYALLISGLVILGLIFVPWGYFQYRSSIDRQVEANTGMALSSNPELAVYRLQVEANGDRLKLLGKLPNQYLRQKAANVAQQSARQTSPNLKLDNSIVAVEVPPDPILAAAEVQRVITSLNQMSGIDVVANYSDGKVAVNGKVIDRTDAAKITQALAQIPGVQNVTNTIEVPPLKLEIKFYFDTGSTKLKDSDRPKLLQVNTFLRKYPSYTLKIIGRSDHTGSIDKNRQLALERAKTVRDALVRQGVDRKRLQIIGIGLSDRINNQIEEAIWLSRRVEFQPINQ